VRDHVEAYVSDQGSHRREQTLLELGKSLLIKAHAPRDDGKDISEYRPISEAFIPAGFMDNSPWSRAAKGVPGLWWIDWRYRKRLVRHESPMGVVAFLKALGAATGPRIEPIDANAYHNKYHFTRVTRGDPAQCPNFPHGKIRFGLFRFGQYSEYGLVGDSQSSDLAAWLQHVKGLSSKERSLRGEALLRTLEDQWELYKSKTTALANGYYSNAEHEIGKVPSRWVWELQQSDWVLTSDKDGKDCFVRPKDTYALTEETQTLLEPRQDSVCRWGANSSDVARVLGFKIEIPTETIIGYLRAARLSGQRLSTHRAVAYYEYLSRHELASVGVDSAFQEGLIFAPGHRWSWRCPEECLRNGQRDVFGDFCGYLDGYASADKLWECLGVAQPADLDFLVRFWARVSKDEMLRGRDLSRVLEATYLLAERLITRSRQTGTVVPVLADGDWRYSSNVFVTDYDDVAKQLQVRGLYRWDNEFPDLMPWFKNWTGIFNVERNAEITVVSTDARPDLDAEARLHAGVQSFGGEVSRIASELWPIVRGRVRDIVRGRVQRVDSLRVQVHLLHPKVGEITCYVGVPAFYRDGNVFMSGLTTLADQSLANALLSGLPLGGQDRWSAISSLRVHLMDDQPRKEDLLDLFDEEEPLPDESGIWDQPVEEQGDKDNNDTPSNHKHDPGPNPAPHAIHPVDWFDIESDEGGDEPREFEGGLEGRRALQLKRPRKTPGVGDRGGPSPVEHSKKSTEERAVDLLRIYVLEPAGVEIIDQRLRVGVGADLVGNDNVFRELKARRGSAADKVQLTSHEYARAGQARAAYELVIVEHVWDGPVITIIQNPLGRLRYHPVGDIMVEGWKELDPPPRVVRLRKIETDSRASNNQCL